VNISKTIKDIPKRKTPFFFTLKSLSNQQQLFLLHRHFKISMFALKAEYLFKEIKFLLGNYQPIVPSTETL